MLGNGIYSKNGFDELKMGKVRGKHWDGKIAAGVANFGFEWLSSQRQQGAAS